jgi:serine/threonine protein kinase
VQVRRATYRGHKRAVKQISFAGDSPHGVLLRLAARELLLLASLDHPNVCKLVGAVKHERANGSGLAWIDLVLELASLGNVADLLKAQHVMLAGDFTTRMGVARDIADVLGFVHKLGIVHGDLKLENVLLRDSGDVALADFGLSAVARTGVSRALVRPDRER